MWLFPLGKLLGPRGFPHWKKKIFSPKFNAGLYQFHLDFKSLQGPICTLPHNQALHFSGNIHGVRHFPGAGIGQHLGMSPWIGKPLFICITSDLDLVNMAKAWGAWRTYPQLCVVRPFHGMMNGWGVFERGFPKIQSQIQEGSAHPISSLSIPFLPLSRSEHIKHPTHADAFTKTTMKETIHTFGSKSIEMVCCFQHIHDVMAINNSQEQ